MRKFYFLLIALLFSAFASVSFSQSSANYTFATNATGSLATDMNGNPLDMSTGTTALVSSGSDDTRSSLANIGFDFWFMGVQNSTFSCTENGIIQLGGNTVATNAYTISANTTLRLLAPFANDMRVGTDGVIQSKTFGTAPNRVTVIEYKNIMIRWASTPAAGTGTWQVRLYENTGIIEYVYGAMATNAATQSTVNVGFSTNTTTGTFVSVSSSHVATTSGTFATFTPTANSTVTHLHSTADGSRRVYRFTPTAPLAPSSLTFTSVGSTNMTLNWVDNAPDELGYAIFRSTDNINFTYAGFTAANVTTSLQIGLSPTTLYYWRVAAHSEGALSSFATGSQSTTACSNLAGGTYTVGPTGNYTSLTSATAALSNGTAGTVIFELQSTYTSASETFPILLTTGACPQTGGVIIRPETGAVGLSISSSNATATIDINGGANFIIDGRPGGTGTAKQLTISNTSLTGTAVRFINEASGNTLRHTTITGVNSGAAGAVVTFAGTTGANGNDNNLIDNCDIRDGATTPTIGIYSLGQSATITNDNITISNSNIFNFFQPGNATSGININSFNNNWTVTGNSFYQTAARTSTASNQHNGVFISNSGSGFTITNNFIGGGAANCGGSAWQLLGAWTNRFVGIAVSAGSTATTSIQGNTIANFSTNTNSSANTSNGNFSAIWVSGGNANIGTVTGNTIGSPTGTGNISVTLQSNSGGTANLIAYTATGGVADIRNNTIGSITLTGATTTIGFGFNGILVSAGTPTIIGNTIGSTTTANSINSITAFTGTTTGHQTVIGINVTTGVTTPTTISNNTVANMNQNGTSTVPSIRGIVYAGTGVGTITSNTVYSISGATANTTVAGAASAVSGIVYTGGSSNAIVSQNTVYGISATNANTVSTVAIGIGYSNPTEGTVTRNRIYDIRNASTGTTATAPPMAIGILLRANNNVTVANNMISLGNAQTSNTQFVGIMNSFTGTIAAKIYFNSVNIQGTAASGALPSFGYLRGDNTTTAVTTPVDIRNNIFTNSRSGGTGKHYAIANNFGATASATGWGTNASNYNLLNATAATLAYWTTDRTFAAWQTASASDANSISNGTISYTDAATADLHVASFPTSIEGNGDPAAIANVTVDFDNQARVDFSPTDIGADAGNFFSSPSIAFTPLTNACGAGQRTLTATITDVDGVPTSGTGLPVLYWRINTGSYSSATGVSIGSNQYQFTFGSGAVIGDVVSYYVVAQDNNGNVGSQPAIGASGYTASPPAVSTPTTNPNSYSVLSVLNGIYTVGVGGTYPTLTAAVNAYNTLCLGGPVTFTLTDATYPSETFPIVINANPQASSVNTLTIKPANGVSPLISSTGVAIVLNGADFVNLDGSNTAGGTTRDLTIQSTNTTTSGVPVVWVASLGAGAGATNNSISNCIIQSGTTGSSTLLTWGVFMGASSGAANGPDNDNNTISNNLIRRAYYGIQAIGGSTSAEVNDNLVIRGNSIGGSTASSDAIGLNGLIIGQANNALISGNDIFGISTTTSFDAVSISSGVTNSFFTSNVIRNHQNTGTNRAAAVSISSGANSDITFANNMIYGVIGNGTSGNTFGCYGFRVTSGSGYKFYYNTVNLSGNRDLLGTLPSSISAAFMISGTTASGIDIRNNIFVNSQTATTPKSYAIYSEAPNTAFSNINFNNYSVSGAQGVLGFLGTDQATLPALRTAFGGNTASVSAVPSFVSSTDLHLTNSPGDNLCMEGKATTITGITTDIDGQTRNASTPDIGADEFVFTPPTFIVTPPAAVCVGGSVNLTAAAITAGSTVGQTFGYFTDAACTNTLATPAAVTTAGTYYIKATFTSGTCTFDQVLPVTVTINALPTISIAVAETSGTTANDGTICVGGSATLTASGATSYVWSTAATTADITVSPTVTTPYTVTGTDANGCQNTASTTITVNALPTPSITVAETSGAANNDGTICNGASATLTAAGGTSYSWSNGATTASITVSPSSTTSYTVTVTDANGCSASTNTTITVTNLPTQFNVTGGGAYCATGVGTAVGLSGSESGVDYQLVLNGTTNVGSPVGGTGSAISFGTQTTAGTYTVVATNATTNCQETMTGSATVSINPLPVITNLAVANLTQPTTCISNDGGASPIINGGAPGTYSFNWTGTGIIQSQQNQSALRVGAYSVTVTDGNGCQATATFSLIGPGGCDICPTIGTVTTSPVAICEGGTATLSATGLVDLGVSYGIGFVVSTTPLADPYTGTVVATAPNGSLVVTNPGPPAVSSATTTYTFNTPGTQYVYAILSPVPADPACRPFKSTQITVNATPDVNAVISQTVCSGGQTTAVSFSGTVPGTIFNWTNNNTSIGLAASGTGNIPSFTATNFTNAPVTATITVTPNNPILSQTSQTFNYTGAAQTWTVPAGVTSIRVKAWGAQGGEGIFSGLPGLGGLGGYSEGDLAVTPGQQLSLYVGGAGTPSGAFTICCGGFNGGGNAQGTDPSNTRGGGGGASDVRIGAATLNDRVIVAGGGGGGCWSISGLTTPVGGAGGGLNGGDGFNGDLNGTGGTQTAGGNSVLPANWENGSFGFGGSLIDPTNTVAGGGGGYYGGAAGNNAGGGSGYIGGVTNATTTAGVRSGNGQIIIEYNAAGTNCFGPSKTFTITVNPIPTVNTVAPVAACNGEAVSVPFSGFVAGTVYEWTNSNAAIGLAASGTGNLSFTATNSGTTPITANIVVTPRFTNNGQTCTGTPIAFTITINPTPTVNTVSNQTLCDGSATTAVSFSGAVTGTVYNWTNDNPSIGLAASGTGNIGSFTAINTGDAPVTATITVTPSYSNGGATCTGTATTFTITVNASPRVNTVSNQTICNGASTAAVNFTTPTTGGTVTYTWTNSNTSIGLAASGTGNIPSFTGINTGTAPVTATVTVTPSYTIPGGSVIFTPVSVPSPVTHNVYDRLTTYTGVSVNGGGNSAVVAPGSTVTLSYNYSVAFPGGFCPGCVVQNQVGLGGTSQTLNCVNPVNNGSNGSRSLSFTAPTTPGVYYIQHGTTLEFSCIPLTFTNNPAGGGTYGAGAAIGSIVVPDAATCTGTPTTFTITVNPTPTVNPVGSEIVCNGASTTATTFTGAVAGTTFSWTNSNTAIGLAASGTGNVPAFTATNTGTTPITSTITVTPRTPGLLQYTVYSTHGGNGNTSQYGPYANSANDFNAMFNTANSLTTVFASGTASPSLLLSWGSWPQLNNGGVPVPNNGDFFGVEVTGTFIPAETGVYSFGVDGDDGVDVSINGTVVTSYYGSHGFGGYRYGNVSLVAGQPYTFRARQQEWGGGEGIEVVWKRPSQSNYSIQPDEFPGCSGTSTSYTITVNPTPTVSAVSNQTVCNGSAVTAVSFSGAVAGTVYNWSNNNTSIGLGASGTGTIPSFTGINTGTTPVTATITVTPTFTNGGVTCSGTPTTFTITVNPTPTVNVVSNQTICNGSNTTAVTFSGAVAGTVYSWTNSNTAIGLAASGTGNIASFAATNTTNAPITATITVTPSYTNNGVTCSGTPTTFTITVNPTPTVNTVANQVVCNGSSTTAVTFTGAVAGTVYSWVNNTPSIGLAANGTATVPSFTAVNNGVVPVVATITVTPTVTLGGVTCTGAPITFTITVNPTPTVTQPTNQVVCNRSNTTAVTFTGAVAGTVYNWVNNTPSIGLAASGTGNIPAFAAVNTTQTPVVATITVTPSFTNGGVTCNGTPRTFTITVNPTPVVVATDLFNQRICLSDGAIALNATPVGGSWSGIGVSGFNFIPGATAVGNYVLTYTYTNQFACTSTDTTTAKVLACDERNRSLAQGGAILYPNPNGGQFNIRVNSTRFQFLQMRIYNALGQLVSTKQWSGLVFGQVLPIDMRHLAAGVYTVRIIYDGGNLFEDRGYQMLITH